MIKSNSISQASTRTPKTLLKSNSEQIALTSNINSKTPTIKLIKNPLFQKAGSSIRETQSSASSPHPKFSDLKPSKLSPSPQEKINSIVKGSLQKFRHQKQELEKIKELAKSWKDYRKKKLEDYNEQTRVENKFKFKSEAFRPKTAWGSPEPREILNENTKIKRKNSGVLTSFDRRANIGLEFYNLKTPRNTTPKSLKPKNKTNEIGSRKNEKSAKEIEDFMKKKRKERKKRERNQKEVEEELQMKRMIQLMQTERLAKKALKAKKKNLNGDRKKKKDKKKSKPQAKKKILAHRIEENSFKFQDLRKENDSCSEDDEVINIMQVRRLNTPDQEKIEGRECAIFGNFSNQFSDSANATEIANKIVEKRGKIEKNSILISSSMPIIELKSVSNESSLDGSEKISLISKMQNLQSRKNNNREDKFEIDSYEEKPKKPLKKSLKPSENIKNQGERIPEEIIFKAYPEASSKSENKKEETEAKSRISQSSFDREEGIKKLCSWINTKIVCHCFLAIKSNHIPRVVSTVKTQIFASPVLSQEAENKKIVDFDLMLDVYSKKKDQKSTHDNNIWENFEFIARTLEYIGSPSRPLPVLLNSEFNNPGEFHFEASECYKDCSDFKNLSSESLKSCENEALHDSIDSLLNDSGSFDVSSEISATPAHFFYQNLAFAEAIPDPEPLPPAFLELPRPKLSKHSFNESFPSIFLENSLSTKETSSTVPCAVNKDDSSICESDFTESDSEPLDSNDENSLAEKHSEKIIFTLVAWIFSEALETAVSREAVLDQLKSNNYLSLVQTVKVKTGISAILNYVNRIWNAYLKESGTEALEFSNSDILKLKYFEKELEPRSFTGFQLPDYLADQVEDQSDYRIFMSIPEESVKPLKSHNKMIFDCINFHVSRIFHSLFTPFWKFYSEKSENMIEIQGLIIEVIEKISGNSSICSGKIPTPDMYLKNGELDEDSLQAARECGINNLLMSDITEEEPVWSDYESNEIETILDLSDLVLQEIVQSEINFLTNLFY